MELQPAILQQNIRINNKLYLLAHILLYVRENKPYFASTFHSKNIPTIDDFVKRDQEHQFLFYLLLKGCYYHCIYGEIWSLLLSVTYNNK